MEVTPVKIEELNNMERPQMTSADIRERVLRAREVQDARFWHLKGIYSNAQMPCSMVREMGRLDDTGLSNHICNRICINNQPICLPLKKIPVLALPDVKL